MKQVLKRRTLILAAWMLGIGGAAGAHAGPPVPYPTVITPGTPEELPFMMKTAGADVVEGARHAEAGQFWVYGFPVAPGARCRLGLTFTADNAAPNITVLGPGDKPLATKSQREADGTLSILWTVPANWPLGARMPVRISAKTGPISVKLARFTQQEPDTNGNGLSDTVEALLTQGLPRNIRPVVMSAAGRPYTVTQAPLAPNPDIDLQTDAVFAYTADASVIGSWKARGYTVWTMGGARDGKAYAEKQPGEVQTSADGKPLAIGDSYYLTPTANRIAVESAFYRAALAGGSEGVCPEEPEYWARAGYEDAFKQAWQRQFNTPWQDPASSVDARWRAGQLAGILEINHIGALLDDAARAKPGVKRMVALHSPLSYAEWGIVCPQYAITSLPQVEDVIGQVWTGTARTPARYAGVRRDRTFSVAYLEYSSLAQLLRGTSKRLWFLMDPLEDNPSLPIDDYKSHYEQTLIAALLFPSVDSYEVMPWPERVYGHIPADYATEITSVIAALQDMHAQSPVSGSAASGDIGVFVSDSMQRQRERPNVSDFDGVFGLTLPLLQRGVPVQMVSLDRADDPGYLNAFKTLLLSYDFQKPPSPHVQTALADWVRRGGSLIFFGGSDRYNAVQNAWWRQAGLDAPQADLWKQLGVQVGADLPYTKSATPEDVSRYKSILKSDGAEHDLRNRRAYTFDLTPFARQTGSVAVRFSDATPQDGWGPILFSAELRVGGKLAAAFQAGSDIENRFLAYDNGSQFNGQGRYADNAHSWTYQFDNLPRGVPVTLTVDMGNGYAVSAAPAQPDPGHTLLAAKESVATAKAFPRLRIGADYAVTIYPQITPNDDTPTTGARTAKTGGTNDAGDLPTVLYTLRAGGAPVWMQNVGRGLVVNVGVAPGFFSASERSAGLLRALTQYAEQRAGGVYREPERLSLQRGRYVVVKTFGDSATVDGRTIDLLSPTLPVAADRTIPPRSLALLYDIGPDNAPPHIGFISGRVDAKIETSTTTGFFVRGPLHTTGAARLHAGGKKLVGVRASDRLGHSLVVQASVEGDTVLLRYPNDPDGVVVRAGWQ